MINTIILGHALNELPKLPAESINCVTCSPPYWGLRDYGVEPVIWDGDKNCKHIWGNELNPAGYRSNDNNPGKLQSIATQNRNDRQKSNFCQKCGAFKGSLGLEPTFELYIKHLCDIFDEVKRVLRKDGTCFVNIADSYGGSGNASGHTKDTKNLGYKTLEMGATQGNQKTTRQYAKCLLDIPYRFSIEMTNRGWIKRNTIIWYKKNCMPSSANDRFTVDFEYLFFFTKNNKAIFWTNEKTLECVGKKPSGIKGIEGEDWKWRECPACKGMDMMINKLKNQICPRCKGSGKIKYSFWSGHDYWFEQQFEESIDPESYTGRRKRNAGTMAKYDKKNYLTAGSIQKDGTLKYGQKYPNRNKRAVWTIPTQPFPEAHFAVYPEELIEIPIKAGCPEFICKKCGKARVKIYERETTFHSGSGKSGNIPKGKWKGKEQQISGDYDIRMGPRINRKGFDYTDCGCNAG